MWCRSYRQAGMSAKMLNRHRGEVDKTPMSRHAMNTVSVTRITSETTSRSPHAARGFTLIEILIVVVILGIIAALVIPQFTDASEQASDASLRNQLQTLHGQIELFRQAELGNPDLIGNQWAELVDTDYLTTPAKNVLNGFYDIGPAPAAGIGWVWRDKGNGTFQLYATNEDATAEFVE
jgi:prepilin-type N-terminal cleavage/methylation domain-containing protein